MIYNRLDLNPDMILTSYARLHQATSSTFSVSVFSFLETAYFKKVKNENLKSNCSLLLISSVI